MGNVVMEATQINYRRDDTLKTVDQKLQELSQESAIDTDIAPVFKSTDTYHAGDLVYYRNKLYVFNVDHTGAWAAADVTATNVSAAMTAALAGKADYADIAGAFSAETSYTAGDLVIYNGIIYRCTNDHTGEWDADDFSATTIGAELNAINSKLNSNVKTATVETGFALTNWGHIRAYMVGNLAIVSVYGLKASADVTNITKCITTDIGALATSMYAAVSPKGIASIGADGNIYVDNITANDTLYFELIGVKS